jgi:hypothetical protein
MCLSCVLSAILLGGTVYWVRKLTFNKDETELQASSLNLYTVFGHILLLALQIVVIYFNIISFGDD